LFRGLAFSAVFNLSFFTVCFYCLALSAFAVFNLSFFHCLALSFFTDQMFVYKLSTGELLASSPGSFGSWTCRLGRTVCEMLTWRDHRRNGGADPCDVLLLKVPSLDTVRHYSLQPTPSLDQCSCTRSGALIRKRAIEQTYSLIVASTPDRLVVVDRACSWDIGAEQRLRWLRIMHDTDGCCDEKKKMEEEDESTISVLLPPDCDLLTPREAWQWADPFFFVAAIPAKKSLLILDFTG
jgi:hypothetical protein